MQFKGHDGPYRELPAQSQYRFGGGGGLEWALVGPVRIPLAGLGFRV